MNALRSSKSAQSRTVPTQIAITIPHTTKQSKVRDRTGCTVLNHGTLSGTEMAGPVVQDTEGRLNNLTSLIMATLFHVSIFTNDILMNGMTPLSLVTGLFVKSLQIMPRASGKNGRIGAPVTVNHIDFDHGNVAQPRPTNEVCYDP